MKRYILVLGFCIGLIGIVFSQDCEECDLGIDRNGNEVLYSSSIGWKRTGKKDQGCVLLCIERYKRRQEEAKLEAEEKRKNDEYFNSKKEVNKIKDGFTVDNWYYPSGIPKRGFKGDLYKYWFEDGDSEVYKTNEDGKEMGASVFYNSSSKETTYRWYENGELIIKDAISAQEAQKSAIKLLQERELAKKEKERIEKAKIESDNTRKEKIAELQDEYSTLMSKMTSPNTPIYESFTIFDKFFEKYPDRVFGELGISGLSETKQIILENKKKIVLGKNNQRLLQEYMSNLSNRKFDEILKTHEITWSVIQDRLATNKEFNGHTWESDILNCPSQNYDDNYFLNSMIFVGLAYLAKGETQKAIDIYKPFLNYKITPVKPFDFPTANSSGTIEYTFSKMIDLYRKRLIKDLDLPELDNKENWKLVKNSLKQ